MIWTVHLEYNPETGHLHLDVPNNVHRAQAILQLAQSQISHMIADRVDAAVEDAAPQAKGKIEVVQSMPN